MDITVKDIYDEINYFAPFYYQESWDNSGLQIGSFEDKVNSVLLCLDVTEDTVKLAIQNNCNLIISHHPLFFKPLKSIDRSSKILNSILSHNLNIISAHTNLDVVPGGVSFVLADMLGIKNLKILAPLEESKFYKVSFFINNENQEEVLKKILNEGIGEFHKYRNCFFTTCGIGNFKPKEFSNPFIKSEKFNENKVEFIVRKDKIFECLNNLKEHHPYEEIAFDVFEEKFNPVELGYGVVGSLSHHKKLHQVLTEIKNSLGISNLRFKGDLNKKIKNVAVCGGSGSSFIKKAITVKADLYITGDIKYHEMLEYHQYLTIVDIGHRASEQPILNILKSRLERKFNNITINVFLENNDFFQYL